MSESQAKEVSVNFSESGEIISTIPVGYGRDREIESGYISRIGQDELRVSPRRPGEVSGTAEGPRVPLGKLETRRRLSFMDDQIQDRRISQENDLIDRIEARAASRRSISNGNSNLEQRVIRDKPTILPMTFDGLSSWHDFKVQFEMLAELNQWNETQKATYLAVQLRGSAQQVLGNLPPSHRLDYGRLLQALRQRFAPSNQTPCKSYTTNKKGPKNGQFLGESNFWLAIKLFNLFANLLP